MPDEARAQKYMCSKENTCAIKPRLAKKKYMDTEEEYMRDKPRREKYMISRQNTCT